MSMRKRVAGPETLAETRRSPSAADTSTNLLVARLRRVTRVALPTSSSDGDMDHHTSELPKTQTNATPSTLELLCWFSAMAYVGDQRVGRDCDG